MIIETQPVILTDSLKKRYFYKFGTNLVNLCLSVVTISIVPRVLGPIAYGNFNFLTEFFNRVMSFFQVGTSIGFYTKLSKRLKEQKLIRFYISFVFIIITFVLIGVTGMVFSPKRQLIWPDQQMLYIFLAAIFTILAFLVQITRYINDAYGLTAKSEFLFMLQRLIGAVIILGLFFTRLLNLYTFFLYHYITMTFILIAWWVLLYKNKINPYKAGPLKHSEKREYIKEFYKYSHPLLIYSLVSLLVGIGDRWLLQIFGGSEQQGIYSLAYKVGAICFIFTSAMTPLITREFSIAHGNKDMKRIRNLFKKKIPLFYFIAAFIAVFVALHATEISLLLGGSSYKEAGMALTIMAFYPIHQTYGQLSGSVFYAAGQTKLYRNIGVSMMIIGLFTTFFFIAPKSYGGLDLAANGLALKMILIQFIGVNIQIFFNTRYMKLPYLKFFIHQIIVVTFLGLLAYFTKFIISSFIPITIISFFLAGIVYSISVFILVFAYPRVVSMSRNEIVGHLKPIVNKIFC